MEREREKEKESSGEEEVKRKAIQARTKLLFGRLLLQCGPLQNEEERKKRMKEEREREEEANAVRTT